MESTKNKQLNICETFYSIQGEGFSVGTPAVFLRLSECNLNCSCCDTKEIWHQSKSVTAEQIIAEWKENGWLDKLSHGAHLVLTGGEPLLQQKALINFIHLLDVNIANKPYIEIETNCTLVINGVLLARINQVNASPKLESSGAEFAKRFNPEALTKFATSNKTKFKFVIIKPDDIQEILNRYLVPFNIDTKNVWLMPEGGNLKTLTKNHHLVVELCKKYLLNFSPRLQIYLWDDLKSV